MPHAPKTAGAPDIKDQDVTNETTDASLKGRDGRRGVEPDDVMSKRAAAEELRQAGHAGDSFIVASDLEDDDERDGAPGTREQP